MGGCIFYVYLSRGVLSYRFGAGCRAGLLLWYSCYALLAHSDFLLSNLISVRVKHTHTHTCYVLFTRSLGSKAIAAGHSR
jgi:hypothetical protein